MSLTDQNKANLVGRNPKYAEFFDVVTEGISSLAPIASPIAGVTSPVVPRTRKCIHLGVVTEHDARCWKLRYHICNLGHPPARPGIECQTCNPDYDPE